MFFLKQYIHTCIEAYIKTDKQNTSKLKIENLGNKYIVKYQNLHYHLSTFRPFKAKPFIKVGAGYRQN